MNEPEHDLGTTPDGAAAWCALAARAAGRPDWETALSSTTDDAIAIAPLLRAPPGEPADRWRGWRAAQAWDVRTAHASPDPAAANTAIRADLEAGATSILAQTAGGRPVEAAVVGNGIVIADRADAAQLFRAVHLDAAQVALEAGADAVRNWAVAIAGVETLGADPAAAHLAAGADPLGAALRGAPLAVGPAVALAVAAVRDWPRLRALRADGRVWHDAGASEAQELAATLATAVAYLRAADDAGLAPAQAARRVELTLAVDADLFLGIAKLRAMRRLWARVTGACGTGAPAYLSAQTSARMQARRDPHGNIVRAGIAAFAAAAGGADAVTVLPHDHAGGPPSPLSRRIARNLQLVLMEESNLHRVADPAGGGWYVEHLTRELATAAWRLFVEIERAGGMIEAVSAGLPQGWVAATSAARAARVARRGQVLVGVNAFTPTIRAPRPAPPGYAGEAALAQEKLARGRPWDGIDDLLAIARAGLTPALDASGPTVPGLPMLRDAEPWERLQDRAERATARDGRRPAVLVVAADAPAARAAWVRDLLRAGGLEPMEGSSDDAVQPSVAILCTGDGAPIEGDIETARSLRRAGARVLWAAGDADASWPDGLIDLAVHPGTDLVAGLTALHDASGTPTDLGREDHP